MGLYNCPLGHKNDRPGWCGRYIMRYLCAACPPNTYHRLGECPTPYCKVREKMTSMSINEPWKQRFCGLKLSPIEEEVRA